MVQTGKRADPTVRSTSSSGNGLMRPLQEAARKAGVQILLEHKMVALYRQAPNAGRVLGVAVETNGIRAHDPRAQGGDHRHRRFVRQRVNFRRMFDPRLTEEYCGIGGMPWSDQDASGELAAMAVGASLWGLYNQTGEFGIRLTKPGTVGNQYGYASLKWLPGSPVFDRARASGLSVLNWQDAIMVNMLGQRFYGETGQGFSSNDYNSIKPYTQGSYLNARNVTYKPNNWINAAMAGIGDGHNGAGPIWAVFDTDALTRESWVPTPPNVDIAGGFFFSADTLAFIPGKIALSRNERFSTWSKYCLLSRVALAQAVNLVGPFIRAEGHQAIGEAARTMLSPGVRVEIQKLLGDDDLASARRSSFA